ncbi:MAG TPA: cyclic nucleotide-binding domain-containing protein [Treponemataceae bacterium]|nr:cyclic nucleotide-binding domain-containing protein [Treponemataceae bacterium]
MIDIIPILSTSELFSGLSRPSLERIALRLKPVAFARDVVICREGDAGSTMYVITKGSVSVSSDMGWGAARA